MLLCYVYWDMVGVFLKQSPFADKLEGGSLVSHGYLSIGDLTSLLLYTVYVGSGLQMLT